MQLTIIHPCVGKIPGKKYLRAWQMEPLPVAQLAALTPKDVQICFWDDRMEEIPYENKTDLVAISVETYTAKRAYQIASEFRKRQVPVIMGGFHATLCTDEVSEYADSVVVGEVEKIWAQIIDDFKNNCLKKKYFGPSSDLSTDILPDRSVYQGKDYVKITLLEAGRGCRFNCEFCSIHEFFQGKHCFRNSEIIVKEIQQLKTKTKLFFFVDDNICANPEQSKKLFKELIPLKIKWVGQADILLSKDEELLDLMVKSGCQGILIGFESLLPDNLKKMNKNLMSSLYEIEQAIHLIHKKGIRIYATFLFGYDNDTDEVFDQVLKFCIKNKFFMVGFNHLTPFPGTRLYTRLVAENRLIYDKWWLSDRYTYGQIPFRSKIPPDVIENECRRIRTRFYSFTSILYRMRNLANISSLLMFGFYISINLLLRRDTGQRKKFPLGDKAYKGDLLKIGQ
jgi:radical SAM superfamily enzyme YgiQ (UPF0313 family)